jgi:myo-inositol-1(or 4)-monophosphatase
VTAQYLQDSFIELQTAFRANRKAILDGVGEAAAGFKDDQSPVTETDIAVEAAIVRHLKERLPDIPVFGEEGGYDSQNLPPTCWLVDPIDGTRSYISNIAAFTSMAALLHDGNVIASIIYDPTSDSMYTAQMGKGAFRNSERINLQNTPLPRQVYCKDKILDSLSKVLAPHNITAVEAPSGAGYGFIQIVEGVSAARFHLHAGKHIHDHAPGALLVKEAGGDIIPTLESRYTFRTNSFVACHPELSDLIRKNLTVIRSIEDPAQAIA